MTTETKAKHTPGPWHLTSGPFELEGEDKFAFTIWDAENKYAVVERVLSSDNAALVEHEANGKLIAQAPALAVVLQECIEDLQAADLDLSNNDPHPKSPDDCRYCCTIKAAREVLEAAGL